MDAHQARARRNTAGWCTLVAACAALALASVMAPAPAAAQGRKAGAAANSAPAAKGDDAEGTQEGEEGQQPNAKKKQTSPAEAKAAIDAAAKLLAAGRAEPAAEALTRTLMAGRLPPAIMAKALLYRGVAYRELKKPAQAIADLTSALWLKGGLADADRADALRQRAAAYREAGLTDTGAVAAAAPDASSGSGAGGWNIFGSLFGSSSQSQPPPAAAPPVAPPPVAPPPAAPPPAPLPVAAAPAAAPASAVDAETAPSPPPQATSAWVRNTQVHGRAGDGGEAASLPPKPEGRFRIQIGMVRTQDQAQEIAIKVKSRYGEAVGQREPEIDETVVGNMGSFYRVRVGPFASPQEGQAACSKLKGSGFDCLVVTQ